MKAVQILLASMLALIAVTASARAGELTREQVQLELKKDFEIRQELAHNKDFAARFGCDLDAISHDMGAQTACDALVAKIASMDGIDPAARLAAFKRLNSIQ